jgi:hypothetical protein
MPKLRRKKQLCAAHNSAWAPWAWLRGPPKHACHAHDDCGDETRFCCDREAHRCVRRDDPTAPRRCGLPAAGAPAAAALVYPDRWRLRPGMPGFNAYVRDEVLARAHIPQDMGCQDGKDRWYQSLWDILWRGRMSQSRTCCRI